MEWKESRSKTTKHKDIALRSLTQRDIEVFVDFLDVLKGVHGEEAQSYFHQYIKLYERYRSLKDAGVNVRVSPLRLGSRGRSWPGWEKSRSQEHPFYARNT